MRAVDPAALVAGFLRRTGRQFAVEAAGVSWTGPTVVVGAGKASPRMAAAAAEILGDGLLAGIIVAPVETGMTVSPVRCLVGGHPLPTAEGERSTAALLDLIDRHPGAAVLALISGGASSLLVQPTPPLSLADKIAVNRALLASGAEIHEFNTVRKHLSQVKGGGLVRRARGRPFTALIISDVIGDEPATIGSGPTAPDPTTFADALAVLERHTLLDAVPGAVIEFLATGKRGGRPDTLKPDARELQGVSNLVIGANRTALEGAAEAARGAGWEPVIHPTPLSGDTTAAATRFSAWAREVRALGDAPKCLLAGGETTVHLDTATGGKGGRNQEFALVCAKGLAGSDIHMLSAGTDGIDGPTDAAGAFVDGGTLDRARRMGLDPGIALTQHDSYGVFAALGDLFRTGTTGTNVMDIKIALVGVPRSSAPSMAMVRG